MTSAQQPRPLGLPPSIAACLFDLDGVLTPTAKMHAAAWQQLFDGFLSQRREQVPRVGWSETRAIDPYRPFDPVGDYDRFVDGRPRDAGVRSFLASRGIELSADAVREMSQHKDQIFVAKLAHEGVRPYPRSLRYLREVRGAGLRTAVVSASTHCAEIVRAAGIEDLLEVQVDGELTRREGLHGKPAPDTYLAAARLLEVPVGRAAVFEDALAGVAAGHAGGFGYVVGVARTGQATELAAQGAGVVVADLADLLGAQPASTP
jgi:HAD superfamily hydrolase (TIGR01509 family)